MEGFNLFKNKKSKAESRLPSVKEVVLSKLVDNNKINKKLADNLYANRILEEELIAPNTSYQGLNPSLPEGAKIINRYGSNYANIGDKMYYIKEFNEGFDLVDNTDDFAPREDTYYSLRDKKRMADFQNKHGLSLSATTESVPREEFYYYDQHIGDLDNWIIHNDMGKIHKNRFTNKDQTWWLKGEPYKGVVSRSLFDQPEGRHLFAKQSALEFSIGRPLDQHMELRGSVIKKGDVVNGGITITPTSEESLSNIEGLRLFTYNLITKSMERGIYYNQNIEKAKDCLVQEIRDQFSKMKDNKEDYRHPGWNYNNPDK